MRQRAKWITVLMLLVLLTAATALILRKREQPPAPRTVPAIRLGAIMALTGDVASYGVRVQRGMELARTEINGTGGISGRPVEIIYEDNQGKPNLAVTAFQKLIDSDHVPMILGPMLSTESLATAPIAERRHVVQMSTLPGTLELSAAGDYVFRLFASDEFQGVYLAEQARQTFHAKTAAIVYVNNAYGDGIRTVIKSAFEKDGGKILGEEAVPEGGTDFRAQLTKIGRLRPDIVFGLVYFTEGGPLLAQDRQLGLNLPVLGGDAWFGPIHNIAGGAEELLTFSSIAFGPQYKDSPVMQRFIQQFTDTYSDGPDSYAATGYDAVYVAKAAIEKGGLSPERIKDALYTMRLQGALGNIFFNHAGDNAGARFSLFRLMADKTVPYVPATR